MASTEAVVHKNPKKISRLRPSPYEQDSNKTLNIYSDL